MSEVVANNENMDEIRKKISETEKDINSLNELLKSQEDEKNTLTEQYESKKKEYNEYKSNYTMQSANGNYFLAVSGIAFVLLSFMALNDSAPDFLVLPASVLFVVGIVLKVLNSKKFKSMGPGMDTVEAEYKEIKEKYDAFMSEYTAKEVELEKKQYEWELVENDMIEARKEAWVEAHKVVTN